MKKRAESRDSAMIVNRFFEALYALQKMRRIRGKKTFCDRYGVKRPNLYKLEKEPSRGIFQPIWLTYLVTEYGISANWLLTGKGNLFKSKSDNDRYDQVKDETPYQYSYGEKDTSKLPEASNNPFGHKNTQLH